MARGLMFAWAVAFACGCRCLFTLCGMDGCASSLLSLAILFHPAVVTFVEYLNSDLPFAALATWLACRWSARWQRRGLASGAAWCADGILVGIAIITRGNGVTLAVAGVVGCLAVRSGRALRDGTAFLFPAILIPGVTTALVASQAGGRDTGFYGSELSSAYSVQRHVWTIPLSNLELMPHVAAGAIWPVVDWATPVVSALVRWPLASALLSAFTLLLICIGLWRVLPVSLGPAVAAQAALTLGVYVVWHYPFHFRFALPLVPLLMVGFAFGVGASLRSVSSAAVAQRGASCAVLLGGMVVLVSVLRQAGRHHGVRGDGVDPQAIAAFDAIRRLTSPGDIIFSGPPPELIYLNAGRRAAPLLDDDRIVSKLPPTWTRLNRWLQTSPRSTAYIFLERPARASPAEFSREANAVTPYAVEQRYASPNGRYWLGRIAMATRVD